MFDLSAPFGLGEVLVTMAFVLGMSLILFLILRANRPTFDEVKEGIK